MKMGVRNESYFREPCSNLFKFYGLIETCHVFQIIKYVWLNDLFSI